MGKISHVEVDGRVQFRCGSRFITEKRLKQKQNLINRNRSVRKVFKSESSGSISSVVTGRRLVHLQHLAQQLWCKACKNCLSLENVETEVRYGLASNLSVRCHSCLAMNNVTTDKKSVAVDVEGQKLSGRSFVTNTKVALGVLHAGIGFSHLNKLLACLNVLPMNWTTFKSCERIVGRVVEHIAKEVCQKAAAEERSLVLQNLDKLKKLLPEGLDDDFLTPSTDSQNEDKQPPNCNLPVEIENSGLNTTILREDRMDPPISECKQHSEIDAWDEYQTCEVASAISQALLATLNDDNFLTDVFEPFTEMQGGLAKFSTHTETDSLYKSDNWQQTIPFSEAPGSGERSLQLDESQSAFHYPVYSSSVQAPTPISQMKHSTSLLSEWEESSFYSHQDISQDKHLDPDGSLDILDLDASHDNAPNSASSSEQLDGSDKLVLDTNQKVRVMVSYDMGWSRRANGRAYDSLNGYGAIIGYLTRKVLDFGTRNRKCKSCMYNPSGKPHDCRLNFHGSAKAMEPHVATQLCTDSSILQNLNLEVGILCGDDDSSTIAAVRSASSHQVVKLSDVNHTQKGLNNALYDMAKKYKELNSKSIDYLKRCFAYALCQNQGDPVKMSEAMRVIPKHAFNDHSSCLEWCGFVRDAENYDHTMIPGGLKDPGLRLALADLFNKFAENTHKFAHGSSSQGNECLNAVMAHHAKKMYCYSMSESADFRYACAVSQTNIGEEYIQKVSEILHHSPPRNSSIHVERIKKNQSKRLNVSKSRDGKKKRLLLKQDRAKLRTKKEQKEGTTYQSDVGLLSAPALENTDTSLSCFVDSPPPSDCAIIYFDIETSGFSKTADVLQIAATTEGVHFEVYINPVSAIPTAATAIHGFTNVNGELHCKGVRMPSVPKRSAVLQFRNYLEQFQKPCILVAHNANFDAPRILRVIKEESLLSTFHSILYGFCDTLPLLKKLMPQRKGQGKFKLTKLASDLLGIGEEGAHNALTDVTVLEQVVHAAGLGFPAIVSESVSVSVYLQKDIDSIQLNQRLNALSPLDGVISLSMRQRMAVNSVTYNDLVDAFIENPDSGIINLLGRLGKTGKPIVTKSRPITTAVTQFISYIVLETDL